MFDNKVDIAKVYGNIAPKAVSKDIDAGVKKLKKVMNYKRSNKVYLEYQAMRKTDEFWVWWKRQYARQHALCYYCKESLKIKRVNVEHIVPMSKGGTNNKKNMVLSCSDCNREKGSKLLKKKFRKNLRSTLQQQIREDRRMYNLQKKIDIKVGYELRQMFKE